MFGASGRTGRALVQQALERGYKVVASDVGGDPYAPDAATQIEADVLGGDLAPALRGSKAVISALGVGNDIGTLADPPPLYTKGTARIADAMKAEGIERIVVMSATFVANSERGPLLFRLGTAPALTNVLDQMEQMEADLAQSRLDWTAVRPGWLMEGPRTDDSVVTEDEIAEGLIRARHEDVAALMLDCVETGQWSRATPAIARSESEVNESNEAVMKSLLA
ncbi:NAD-dependent epimerase/dehydratase family protein [Pelagovum pacificum]|uniref:NAD-dependent epimerase/dehydratase family protein n=1 Tax=Pelagovum pacificum TaxID=2588711 RepID=A0A5C5G9U3_9RHOB|nr:NAD(P)H-binding protein [Pelagovum pacificum]TNY30785.1 NAD-dependent epimerase/dehydratase family protein [Pelagovum pacificum]